MSKSALCGRLETLDDPYICAGYVSISVIDRRDIDLVSIPSITCCLTQSLLYRYVIYIVSKIARTN